MRRLMLMLLPVLLLSALAVGWAATTPEEVEEDHDLTTSLVTPHTPWAKGFAGGSVRALVFVFAGHYGGEWDEPGNRLREVNELMQRFDIDADAVFYARSGDTWSFHGGRIGEERAERLLAEPYDLYVIAGFPMERLPSEMQYRILERVVAGAGLLYCGQDASDYLTEKRRITPTPGALVDGLPGIPTGPELTPQLPVDVASAYQLRAGRAAWLRYPAFALTQGETFSWRGLADYEYRMLLVGRAALWAAGREGSVAITAIGEVGPITVRRGDAGAAAITLATTGDQAATVTLSLALRRPIDRATVMLPEQTVTVAADRGATVFVPLPTLRAGEYYLDVIARSGRGVEAAGAGNVVVTSDFGVESLSLDGSFIEPGESMAGTVTLRGEAPAGSVLRVRLRDSYDRVVAQQELPVVAGQATYPVSFTPDANATIELRAEAVLIAGGDEVEMAQASFTVPKRRQGRMNFVQWDTPRDVLGYYSWQVMKDAGWEISLLGSMGGQPTPIPPVLAASDISIVPYSTRILDRKDENGFMQPVCWNDEPAVDEYVQGIVDRQARLREAGVFVYSLGDEGVTKGCCVHPACIDAYRGWLEGQYETIDALNESWGSNYASFAEVDLLDRADNMESAARESAPARWYDRQAFARWNLSNYVGRFRAAYDRLDPEALTGYEGTGGFGDDYDAICTTNTFYGPYPSIGDDLVRSIFPRERVRSNWMGYSKTADALSDAAWRMVMKGMDSIWFWMWDGIGTYRGTVRPTMDLWPAMAEVTAEMRPVQRGLGDLIIASEPAHSGIAVFYSVASALAGSLPESSAWTRPQSVHEALTEMTYELGLDFRYLTSALVTGGELTTDEFRVLLLPVSAAISPEEAEAIRAFVVAGGTVIADVRPGVFDGHCKPLQTGALDDVFGITRTARDGATDAAVQVSAELEGTPVAIDLPKTRLDAGVQAATAQALGAVNGAPVLLVNRFGQGRAVLLNFQLPAAGEDTPEAMSARRLLGALYGIAGAGAPVQVAAPNGEPLPFTETRAWRNGEALIVGTYRKMRNAWFNPTSGTIAGEPVAAVLTVPAGYHVYDLRAGRYAGEVEHLEASLRWGRANFYALLPYRLQGLSVALSSATPEPGPLTVTVGLDVPASSRAKQAVFLQVIDPAGAEPQWGRRVMLLERGTGETTFTVAHNDLPGQWRVRATELFSGESAEAAWTID